jgi:hypothetical protein
MLQRVSFQAGELVEPVRLPVLSNNNDYRIKSKNGVTFRIKAISLHGEGRRQQFLAFHNIEGEYPAIAFQKVQ